MNVRLPVVVVAILLLFCQAGTLRAEGAPGTAANKKLIIGTKQAPPFAMKNEDSTWSGVSIDLWRKIAADMGVEYEFREFDLPGLLQAVQDGSVDVAAASLTVTSDREKVMDFSHPFHTTGLSIAVIPRGRSRVLRVVERFLSLDFLKVVAALAAVLLIVGAVVWLFARRRNAAQFGGGVQGIGAGSWWSAVTMATVGHGDKAPVTLGRRIVAIMWVLTALIIIAGFMGAIASALTVGELEATVSGPVDLPHIAVGTLPASTSEGYLTDRAIRCRLYRTMPEGLQALVDGKIEAFVYDAPLLQYMANTEFRGAIHVLPQTFERQDYAFALPSGSELREPINRSLLRITTSPEWQAVLQKYLGE